MLTFIVEHDRLIDDWVRYGRVSLCMDWREPRSCGRLQWVYIWANVLICDVQKIWRAGGFCQKPSQAIPIGEKSELRVPPHRSREPRFKDPIRIENGAETYSELQLRKRASIIHIGRIHIAHSGTGWLFTSVIPDRG